jgi:hypothetical protein
MVWTSGRVGRSFRCLRRVRLRLSLQHLTVLSHVVRGLARMLKVLRVRGRWPAGPVLCPVSRGALFVRGWGGACHLSLGGRGDTYAARTAVVVVGYDGVSVAITLVVGRWWCKEEAKVRRAC